MDEQMNGRRSFAGRTVSWDCIDSMEPNTPIVDGGQGRDGASYTEMVSDLAWTLLCIAILGACIAAFWLGVLAGALTSGAFVGGFLAGWHERGAEHRTARRAAVRGAREAYRDGRRDEREVMLQRITDRLTEAN